MDTIKKEDIQVVLENDGIVKVDNDNTFSTQKGMIDPETGTKIGMVQAVYFDSSFSGAQTTIEMNHCNNSLPQLSYNPPKKNTESNMIYAIHFDSEQPQGTLETELNTEIPQSDASNKRTSDYSGTAEHKMVQAIHFDLTPEELPKISITELFNQNGEKEEKVNLYTESSNRQNIENPIIQGAMQNIPKEAKTLPVSNHVSINMHSVTDEPPVIPFQKPTLSKADIYIPAQKNNSEFVILEKERSNEKDNQLPVMIYKEIKSMRKIRAYERDLYIFNESKGVYEKLSSNSLHYLINLHFGTVIDKQGTTASYYTAEDFLKKDASLVVTESEILPLEYWGFRNCFYNIYTGSCIRNDGTYFIRDVFQCNLSLEASCRTFDKYLYAIAAGDEKLITLLWEVIGYLLSNDTNGKAFFAFIGAKDTGKSLLANLISRIVSEDAISHLSANDFSGRFDVSELNGKHLNICMDLPDRALSPDAVGKIKSITGNDMIRSDIKHKDSISFKPTARLLFGANAQIRTEQPDSAFYDRLILVPFLYPIPKDRQDHNLEKKLVAEASGICLKAAQYYKQLRERSYIFTKVSIPEEINTTINYNAVIQKFAQESCDFTKNPDDKISSDTLYMQFENFCGLRNLSPSSQAEFSKRFSRTFADNVEKKKIKFDGIALNGFTGIRLKGGVHNENN